MSKKYKEELNKIVMNEHMKKRILQNVLATNENDNRAEKNMKVKTTIPKVKKFNSIKRNMQMAAACFAMVLCLSVAKNYPMLLKNPPNDLEQKDTAKSHEDENNDLKNSDNKEVVHSEDSKEIAKDNNKDVQALDQNNNYNNANDYAKVESNTNSKIEQEEKENSKSNLSSKTEKSQTSQNNNDKVIENSNISAKTNTEEDINNENKKLTNTESKATDEDIMKSKISGNDTDSSVSVTSVGPEKAIYYNQEYKTLEEAEKALNLKVAPLKTLPKGFEMEIISVIANKIIQVNYTDGNNNIVFRAGKDTDNISGDYNVYQVNNTANVNGINVNFQGNKSKEYNLAVWEKDGISYSISAKNGIDEKTILGMIS